MAAHRPLTPARSSRRATCLPPVGDPVTAPTDAHPRWRLRVFDRCWPWRATRGEAMRDAVASRNARRDRDDRVTYLDAIACIQRDPPHHLDRLRHRERCAARTADAQDSQPCDG